MLDNILFKATPENFGKALRYEVPKDNFSADYANKNGQQFNIDTIAADLDSDYKYLYDNYINASTKDLAIIKATDQFLDWRAKMAFLYEAIGGSGGVFTASVSYPWVLGFFADMTVAEVKAVSEASNDYNLGERIGTYTLESPASLPGKTGVVTYSGYKYGLRLAPEMSNLMNVFRANGIDVYVCSASHETVVRVFAGLQKYGYNVPEENVIGMKTVLTNGKYAPAYDYNFDGGYPQTQGKGKVTAIKKVLVDKKGYEPIFIAGDSAGDYNMATEFQGTLMTLVINRVRSDVFGQCAADAVYNTAGQDIPRYVLQGRNENTGQFRPAQDTIRMGRTSPQLLNDKFEIGRAHV
jgi:phosphoserine phosphatase